MIWQPILPLEIRVFYEMPTEEYLNSLSESNREAVWENYMFLRYK